MAGTITRLKAKSSVYFYILFESKAYMACILKKLNQTISETVSYKGKEVVNSLISPFTVDIKPSFV